MYLESLKHNLANLLRFSGRSSPRQFWPYAGTLLGLAFVAMPLLVMPVIVETIRRTEEIARTDPANVTETYAPGSYSITVHGNHPELMPDFGAMLMPIGAVTLVFALLAAASVSRRLHDRNWHGWWALIPLALLISGLVLMNNVSNAMVRSPNFDPSLVLGPVANNIAYLATLVVLLLQLVQAGTPGPNRFGDPPA